jgi:hypothetical protein
MRKMPIMVMLVVGTAACTGAPTSPTNRAHP